MSSLLGLMAWPFMLIALVALVWLVRRVIERERLLSEIDAYGQQVEIEDLPDTQTPLTLFFGLFVFAVLLDILF